MKLGEREKKEFKQWANKRLESMQVDAIGDDSSDADSDVLAEYALALFKGDQSDEEIRDAMLHGLKDFLNEHTQQFVDEAYAKFGPKPASTALNPVNGIANGRPRSGKRPYEGDGEYKRDRTQNDLARRRKREDESARNGWNWAGPAPISTRVPMLSAGFPPVNTTDPMSSFLAMHAMLSHPSMPLPSEANPATSGQGQPNCPTYDNIGCCILGSSCPFQHGPARLLAQPEEYDPNNAMMDTNMVRNTGRQPIFRHVDDPPVPHLTLDRTASPLLDGKPVSQAQGSPTNSRNCTLVIERIPQDNYEEGQIRAFFSTFGQIARVTMQPEKHIALVQYTTPQDARRAWQSPKAVFDNRFVKIYWLKPEHRTSSVNGNHPLEKRPELDVEALRAQQAVERQKHEERLARLQRIRDDRIEILRKQDEVLQRQRKEKAALLAKLGSKGMLDTDLQESIHTGETHSGSPNKSEVLKQYLAQLEAEAQNMGIDPDAATDAGTMISSRGRGRGLVPWNLHTRHSGTSPRGRGRKSSFRPAPRCPNMKLDNRPKNIKMVGDGFHIGQPDRAAALQRWLANNVEPKDTNLEQDENGNGDAVIVSFTERWQAEQVMDLASTRHVPGLEGIRMSWVTGPSSNGHTVRASENKANGLHADDDKKLEAGETVQHEKREEEPLNGEREINLDAAGDDEWDASTT